MKYCIAKIGDRWRFSDLISYFCNWFRADPRDLHIDRRLITIFFHTQTSQL